MKLRRRHLVTAAAAVGGLALFGYAVQEAGAAEIAEGIRRVGWGLLPILGLGGLRFILRAESWRLCMPAAARMPLLRAFSAFLAGDAIGNITPLGPVASEPTKVFLIRHRLATRESVASLAVDNFMYAASVITMVAAGMVVLLVTVPLPFAWREAAIAALLALVIGVGVGLRLLRGTWTGDRGQRPAWRARLASLRESVLQFLAGRQARLWRVFLLHMAFHALAVFEVFITLRWLLGEPPSAGGFGEAGRSPTLAQAVVFGALDRVVTVTFKFVPLRVGVDEAASSALASMLGWPPAAGVTLAVVRKVRNLFWTGIGALLTAAHPVPAAPATDRPGTGRAHRT